jgi:TRAP-type C4-dicarboxylate transport system substrate-binding protein
MIEELAGTVDIKLIPGSQLFDSRTSLVSIGAGIVDAGEVITSYSRSYLKHAVIMNDLMYLGRSELVINAAATETILRDCPSCIADFANKNTLYLSGAAAGSYSMLCKSKVTTLADIKGKKFRAIGANRRWVRALGGIPVSLSINDMVEGLSRGLVDCIVGPVAWLKSLPIIDDVNYVYRYNVGAFSFATMVINRDTWDGLGDVQKSQLWHAQPGLSARIVIQQYVADAIRATMLAKQHDIPVILGSQDINEFWLEFREQEVAQVNQISRSLGARQPEKISASLVENIEKWRKIIAGSGLHKIASADTLNQDELTAAVDEYTTLLNTHIYQKIDPLTL